MYVRIRLSAGLDDGFTMQFMFAVFAERRWRLGEDYVEIVRTGNSGMLFRISRSAITGGHTFPDGDFQEPAYPHEVVRLHGQN